MAGQGAVPPGMPGMGAFDFSAIQGVLNDPNIMQMAQQIAEDPSFREMTKALQESMKDMLQPAAGAGSSTNAEGQDSATDTETAARGTAEAPIMDQSKYFEAMNGILQNPDFMQMAEKLGQQIMQQEPSVAGMMQSMANPDFKETVTARMEALKSDPELGPIIQDIEANGPPAMMKYWNDPNVLAKLGAAMQGAIDNEDGEAAAEGEEDEEPTVHSCATDGDAAKLKELLEAGHDLNAKDEEGRRALHFACGYGEIECATVLLEAKADINALDANNNTALHYAAGYGQADCVKLLLDHGADTTLTNLDGKTPVEVAELNAQEAVVKVLKEHKA